MSPVITCFARYRSADATLPICAVLLFDLCVAFSC
jgi:hypothetical protein